MQNSNPNSVHIFSVWKTFLIFLCSTSLVVFSGTQPVFSDEADSPQETVKTIEKIAPEITKETDRIDSIDFSGNTLEASSDENNSAKLKISIKDVSPQAKFIRDDTGIYVAESKTGDTNTVVQPTSTGVRIMTVIHDREAPDAYSYKVDVPKGTQLLKTEFGYKLDHNGEPYGTLLPEWALDANGKSVPTWYSWDKETLTQHVDLADPSITFPVVADPGWGYTYKYKINKTAEQAKRLLKRCFNCYFPVTGAPKNFPILGEYLKLRDKFFNFECRFAGERSSRGIFFFKFKATGRHVDGFGSRIKFVFMKIDNQQYLVVEAYVANNHMNNPIYRYKANETWQKFANNINGAR
ncbi:hypothetical protein KRX56_01690 [Dermabacteraceae bacterium TAE3-ERU27]|nr:hypothetical protein [Dermabacteraceae bacterium TAE3-ERU27]